MPSYFIEYPLGADASLAVDTAIAQAEAARDAALAAQVAAEAAAGTVTIDVGDVLSAATAADDAKVAAQGHATDAAASASAAATSAGTATTQATTASAAATTASTGATTATTKAAEAVSSAAAAAASAATATAYANTAQDTEIAPGVYSAKHWALETQAYYDALIATERTDAIKAKWITANYTLKGLNHATAGERDLFRCLIINSATDVYITIPEGFWEVDGWSTTNDQLAWVHFLCVNTGRPIIISGGSDGSVPALLKSQVEKFKYNTGASTDRSLSFAFNSVPAGTDRRLVVMFTHHSVSAVARDITPQLGGVNMTQALGDTWAGDFGSMDQIIFHADLGDSDVATNHTVTVSLPTAAVGGTNAYSCWISAWSGVSGVEAAAGAASASNFGTTAVDQSLTTLGPNRRVLWSWALQGNDMDPVTAGSGVTVPTDGTGDTGGASTTTDHAFMFGYGSQATAGAKSATATFAGQDGYSISRIALVPAENTLWTIYPEGVNVPANTYRPLSLMVSGDGSSAWLQGV